MMRKSFAIIGCGSGGLAAALFLARAGHGATLFERFTQPGAVGAGILLQPTGMNVLRELDLLEHVAGKAARIDALDGRTCAGKRIMNVSYADLSPDAFALGVHRASLLDALHAAAVQAGVALRFGAEVIALEGTARRTLVLADGEKVDGFDGVVLANGTQSALRSTLAVPHTCRAYPWGALWAICAADDRELPPVLAQRYDGAAVMAGIMPTGCDPRTGKPCASFFWSIRRNDYAAWREGDFDGWKARVRDCWPQAAPVLAQLHAPDALTFASYADVRMPHWHDGNVVVIGDAAHGMSPQLGQGANLALMDALVLGECIAEAKDVAPAFAEYSRRRRAHLRYYQLASRALTPLFQSDSRLAAWLRDWSFPLMARVPFMRREAVRTVAGVKTGLLFDTSISGTIEPARTRSTDCIQEKGEA